MRNDETTPAIPPRYRALKRWSLFALIVFVVLAAVRLWWGHAAQRRMEAFVAAAHARGEKILPADFVVVEPLPDEQNAAVLLKSAAPGIVYTPQQQTWEANFARTLPLTAADVATIQALAWQNRRALAQVRQARSIAGVDWRIQPGGRTFSTAGPIFNQQRGLASLIVYVALYEHAVGNDTEFIELMLDLDRQRSAVGQISPSMLTMLVAAGLDGLLSNVVLDVAPALDVTGMESRAAATTTRPASRRQVRDLIDRLLDDTDTRDIADRASQGERMFALDSATAWSSNMEPGVLAPVLRPLYVFDAVRAAERSTQLMAATQPTLPAALATTSRLSGSGGAKSHLHEVATAMSETLRQPKVNEAMFRTLSDRRAAAIVLGVRLYSLDHAAALPPTLEALVPDYLSRVPADPMSSGGQPFRYAPGGTMPRIYSVGIDGIDNGGTPISANRWANADAAYSLTAAAPAAPATPAGVTTTTAPATRSGS